MLNASIVKVFDFESGEIIEEFTTNFPIADCCGLDCYRSCIVIVEMYPSFGRDLRIEERRAGFSYCQDTKIYG